MFCRSRLRTSCLPVAIVLLVLTGFISSSYSQVPKKPAPANGSDTPTTTETPQITSESIQKRIDQIKNIKDLTEDNQKKAGDFYSQALANLSKTAEMQENAGDFAQKAKDAMQRLNEVKQEIENLNKEPAPSFNHIQDLPKLQQMLVQEEANLEQSKQQQANWDEQLTGRVNRQKEILTRIAEIDNKVSDLDKQLALPAPADEPAVVTDARKTELKTRISLLKTEKPALRAEQSSYEAEEAVGYPRVRQDFLKLQTQERSEEVEALKKQIAKRRNIESEMRVQEARDEVFATNPLLQPLAEKNQQYAEDIQALNHKIQSVDQKYSQTSKILDELKKQFTQTKEKETSIGLTGPIGLLLRNQQSSLPDVETRKLSIE
ncbi:MAG: hypothetical protein CME32_20925, partial [Gimesia sp.]|nr:hypothetical protein [Gimesia sp.]